MRRYLCQILASFIACAGVSASATGIEVEHGAALSASQTKQIDELFAAWATPTTPGCALAVARGGRALYIHGYGMADLEHAVPITSATVFHVASVSKQFTAMAIYLLAQSGKLSLDDDVRKYLPELHQFARPITLRELLHHTSGLRDWLGLLPLAGWRLDDVITEQDILDLVWRQKGLITEPGEAYFYTNTGYTLLAVIVKRVSGEAFGQFTDERIFRPLAMRHTRFQEEYSALVPGRAYSYQPLREGGYRYVALSYSTVGATGLLTSVADLLRWDENFYTGRVGGQELLSQMQKKGMLNNGQEIPYASGLNIGEYRGLQTVEHSGADAGFRAEILRFPQKHFSVVVLCNAAESNPPALVYKVSDIALGPELAPLPASTSAKPAPRVEVKIDPRVLDAYVGDYEWPLGSGYFRTFTRIADTLVAQLTGYPDLALVPASSASFFPKPFDVLLTFDAPGPEGKSMGFTEQVGGRDTHWARVERARPTQEQLQAYSGTFFSDELNAVYTVTHRNGKLYVRYPRGELELAPTLPDLFWTASPIRRLRYTCARAGQCDRFVVSTDGVVDLPFERIVRSTTPSASEPK